MLTHALSPKLVLCRAATGVKGSVSKARTAPFDMTLSIKAYLSIFPFAAYFIISHDLFFNLRDSCTTLSNKKIFGGFLLARKTHQKGGLVLGGLVLIC